MTWPRVKKALAANASALFSPASSRKIVLIPQMNDDASVVSSVRTRYVRSTVRAGSAIPGPFARRRHGADQVGHGHRATLHLRSPIAHFQILFSSVPGRGVHRGP